MLLRPWNTRGYASHLAVLEVSRSAPHDAQGNAVKGTEPGVPCSEPDSHLKQQVDFRKPWTQTDNRKPRE